MNSPQWNFQRDFFHGPRNTAGRDSVAQKSSTALLRVREMAPESEISSSEENSLLEVLCGKSPKSGAFSMYKFLIIKYLTRWRGE